MGLIETEGIVLKNHNLSEADKIVVLLTSKQGIIRGVAKGAKRLKSKFGGTLEPFTVIQIEYFQKDQRELVSIRGIDLVKSYFEKTTNPLFLQKFSYLAEILLEFMPLNDPNEKIYRMVKTCLETVSPEIKALESIILYFEIWLLRLNGYLPDWNHCDLCKRKFEKNETAALSNSSHLICSACQKESSRKKISPQLRDIFYLVQTLSPHNFMVQDQFSTKEIKEISGHLKKLISNILGKEIIGEKVLIAGL